MAIIKAENELEEFGTQIAQSAPPSSGLRLRGNNPDEGTEGINLDEEANLGKSTKWIEIKKGVFLSSQETLPTIKAGVYRYVRVSDSKFGFVEAPINIDELLVMPDSTSADILKEIQSFLDKADAFKYYGFLHRRGFLFYGPHGSGKSSLVQQIIKQVVDQNGIVLLCENPVALEMDLTDLRAVEPNRFIVCLFEDIDALIQRFGEKEILAVLDGESQINKVLNIATTNYPEVLDKRIVARPRRFDKVIKIDWPCKDVRAHYFKHKLKIADEEIKQWVDATDKFSFAACAELVISVKCLDKPFEQAVKDLRKLMSAKPSSNEFDLTDAGPGFARK